MKYFAVIGNPIKHSKSPIIHKAFAEQCNIKLSYETKLVDNELFESEVNNFFAAGGLGLNITLPFKERAFEMADIASERAALAKASNTLYKKNGLLYADNTDGEGLIKDLHFHGINLQGKTILILGAGGACRGAVPAILQSEIKHLTIANRTKEKATEIATEVNSSKVTAKSLLEVSKKDGYDVIINSTSSSVTGNIPNIDSDCYNGILLAYDMFYSNTKTVFQIQAEQNGALKTLDGKGMLIEQAAEAFYIWHGIMPDTTYVRTII